MIVVIFFVIAIITFDLGMSRNRVHMSHHHHHTSYILDRIMINVINITIIVLGYSTPLNNLSEVISYQRVYVCAVNWRLVNKTVVTSQLANCRFYTFALENLCLVVVNTKTGGEERSFQNHVSSLDPWIHPSVGSESPPPKKCCAIMLVSPLCLRKHPPLLLACVWLNQQLC